METQRRVTDWNQWDETRLSAGDNLAEIEAWTGISQRGGIPARNSNKYKAMARRVLQAQGTGAASWRGGCRPEGRGEEAASCSRSWRTLASSGVRISGNMAPLAA